MDALEARCTHAAHSAAAMATLAHISDHLSHVESELAPNHIKGLKHRTDALAAAAELQVRCFTIASSTAIHLESFVFTILGHSRLGHPLAGPP